MDKTEYTISLRIEHPSTVREEIIQRLGLVPKFSYTVGEPRSTPSGKPLDGFYKLTYCCFDIIPTRTGDFTDGLKQVFKQFDGFTDYFTKLTAEGGKVEIFVGIFAVETVGFTLSVKDAIALASMSLELSVEVYAP